MRSSRTLAVLLCATISLALGASPASGDQGTDPEFGGRWKPGLEIGGHRWDAARKEFVRADPSVANTDPNDYKYELQCHLGDGDFDSVCLRTQLKCTDGPNGEDGIPVVWLSRPRGIPGAVWARHSGPTCLYDPKPEDVLPRIAGAIQKRFETLPVDAGAVVAQPSPHTLRGAETNFYADAKEQQFDITMFGQKVHVVATPVQYTWNYGDGTSFGPQPSMGGPLPQDRWGEKTRTSHAYGATGDFQIVMTTSFRGTYSVNDGPPLPIPGEGQFSAAPQTISVWRSITRNYADDCNVNPTGQGCPGS